MKSRILAVFLMVGAMTVATMATLAIADTRVNADALIVQEFSKRIVDYEQMVKALDQTLPRLKVTGSQLSIEVHQHALAEAIREARKTAKPGDIFTPQISAEFRRLTGLAMQGADAARIRKSLQDSEPVQFQLKVNDAYPSGVPQQSTPPSLLMNLPPLPSSLQYRLLGSTLILLDSNSNLVVDLMRNALP
jgi:hypothetical protein